MARRPAAENSRSRSRFGSPRRAWCLARASICSHPGQLARERDEDAPDAVLGEVVQRQVGQPGVLGAADATLGAGTEAVLHFKVGELAAGSVGCERGDPHAVRVGDP
jgi:hypothetical protein